MTKDNKAYESPIVEIIEVLVEQGFATTGGTTGFEENPVPEEW